MEKNEVLIQDDKNEEPILKTNHAITFDAEDEEEAKNVSVEKKSDLFSFPVPQKSYQHQEKIKQLEEPIMHLCVLSKVKKSSVDVSFVGKVVHRLELTGRIPLYDLRIQCLLEIPRQCRRRSADLTCDAFGCVDYNTEKSVQYDVCALRYSHLCQRSEQIPS